MPYDGPVEFFNWFAGNLPREVFIQSSLATHI